MPDQLALAADLAGIRTRLADSPFAPIEQATDEVAFITIGAPQTAGSHKRLPRRGGPDWIVDANRDRLRPWQASVAVDAAKAMRGRPLLTGPLQVTAVFTFTRPKGHYRTGRFAGQVRPAAPLAPAVAPDLDKLVRGLLDALSHVTYHDDGQVCSLDARKRYGAPEQTQVVVRPLLEVA